MKTKLTIILFGIITACLSSIFYIYHAFQSHENSLAILVPSISVLATIMAAAITTLVFDCLLKKESDQEKQSFIRECINDGLSESNILKPHGIRAVHQRFSNEHFIRSTIKSKNIYILQTYIPNLSELRPAIVEALKSNCNVKIAILDPAEDSTYVDIRSLELDGNHGGRDEFSQRIASDINRLKNTYHDSGESENLEVRLYKRSPGICLYATSELMMISAFLSKTDAINTLQLEMDSASKAYQVYLEHFYEVWDSAEKVKFEKKAEMRPNLRPVE